MGSEEKPCARKVGNRGEDLVYEDNCPKKTVYLALAGGTGIGGPKYRVEISGDAVLVDEVKNAYIRSLG